ncbi:hypothetical protein EEK96_13705 [Escherichia coli]|nr:hypothetical protein [Escherichia coli]
MPGTSLLSHFRWFFPAILRLRGDDFADFCYLRKFSGKSFPVSLLVNQLIKNKSAIEKMEIRPVWRINGDLNPKCVKSVW